MHISKMNIGRSLQNKTDKGKKQMAICLKSEFVLILKFACKEAFCVQEVDVLVREHRRTT